MARLDVRRLRGPKTRVSFVLELQSDYMRDLPTVLVAPLIGVKQLKAYDGINPLLKIGDVEYAVRLEQMAGVPAAALGERVGSAAHLEASVSAAINRMLFYV